MLSFSHDALQIKEEIKMAEGEIQGKCGLQKEDITNFLKTPLRKGDTW